MNQRAFSRQFTELFTKRQVSHHMPCSFVKSNWSRWLLFALIFSLFSAPLPANEFKLPDIGNPSGNVLSPADERRLGSAFMRSIRSSMTLIQDRCYRPISSRSANG